jgi:hypothetical protein
MLFIGSSDSAWLGINSILLLNNHTFPSVSLTANWLSMDGKGQLKRCYVLMRRNHVTLHDGVPHAALFVVGNANPKFFVIHNLSERERLSSGKM